MGGYMVPAKSHTLLIYAPTIYIRWNEHSHKLTKRRLSNQMHVISIIIIALMFTLSLRVIDG